MKPSSGNSIWKSNGIVLALAVFLLVPVLSNAKSSNGGTNDAKKGSTTVKRDPFWPVGYVPKDVQSQMLKGKVKSNVQMGSSWNEAMKKVVINGVSSRSGGDYFAIINGEVKSVGDTVAVSLGNTTYVWAVDNIKPPGSVKLRRVSVH